MVVLVRTTLSVRPVLLLLFPLVRAIISNINTAPPTTKTHGSVYQVFSCEVEVAVVVVAVTVLSCAHAIALLTVNKNSRKLYFKNPGLIKCFIFIIFWLKKILLNKQFCKGTIQQLSQLVLINKMPVKLPSSASHSAEMLKNCPKISPYCVQYFFKKFFLFSAAQ